MKSVLLLCGAVALIGTSIAASAGTLFSEDFSGATPGTYGSAIPGSAFAVTAANIDIVGQLNGSFFTCTDNPGGNCIDLVGNNGAGAITSNPTFTLKAGNSYTVTFGAILQGYTAGQGFTSFTVGLGSLSQQESVTGTPQQFALTFSPTAAQSNAALSFTTDVAGDQVHGAVLDRISLTETAPAVSGTPEPASWALMLAGFGVVGGVMRRRATMVNVAA